MILGNGGLNRINIKPIPFICGLIIIILFLALGLWLGDYLNNRTDMNEIIASQQTLYFLAAYICAWIGIVIAVRGILMRPIWILGWQERGFQWRDFFRSFTIFGLLFLAVLGVTALLGFVEKGKFDQYWVIALPFYVILFGVQISAEEYIFRGYLQRVFYDWFGLRLMWMIVPSVIFAALHYAPSFYGSNAFLACCSIFVLALLAAELTYKTGSIAWASGLHFANNFFVLLIIAPENGLGAPLLHSLISPNDATTFKIALMFQIILFLLLFIVVYFKMPRLDEHDVIDLTVSKP